MKNIKRWLCLGLMICAVGTLSGCSFQETWSLLTGKSQKTEEGTVEEMDPSEIMTKDDSVAVPEFSANLEGSVNYLIHEEAAPLTVEASAGETGNVTYQWYVNSVETNGGGTRIEGATEASYTPSTETAGKLFYYVVATNTEENKFNMETSGLVTVQVSDPDNMTGEWSEDEGGAKIWLYEDGTFATDTWKEIEGSQYAFDENGHVRTGFFQDGDFWYYLGEDGIMQKDTSVEGQTFDSEGHWVPVEGADGPQAAIDAAAEAAAAEAAAAEAAAAEAAAAEAAAAAGDAPAEG